MNRKIIVVALVIGFLLVAPNLFLRGYCRDEPYPESVKDLNSCGVRFQVLNEKGYVTSENSFWFDKGECEGIKRSCVYESDFTGNCDWKVRRVGSCKNICGLECFNAWRGECVCVEDAREEKVWGVMTEMCDGDVCVHGGIPNSPPRFLTKPTFEKQDVECDSDMCVHTSVPLEIDEDGNIFVQTPVFPDIEGDTTVIDVIYVKEEVTSWVHKFKDADFYCVNEEYIYHKLGNPFCGSVEDVNNDLVKIKDNWINKDWLKKFDVSPQRFFDGQPKEYKNYYENVIIPAKEKYRQWRLEIQKSQDFIDECGELF